MGISSSKIRLPVSAPHCSVVVEDPQAPHNYEKVLELAKKFCESLEIGKKVAGDSCYDKEDLSITEELKFKVFTQIRLELNAASYESRLSYQQIPEFTRPSRVDPEVRLAFEFLEKLPGVSCLVWGYS